MASIYQYPLAAPDVGISVQLSVNREIVNTVSKAALQKFHANLSPRIMNVLTVTRFHAIVKVKAIVEMPCTLPLKTMLTENGIFRNENS